MKERRTCGHSVAPDAHEGSTKLDFACGEGNRVRQKVAFKENMMFHEREGQCSHEKDKTIERYHQRDLGVIPNEGGCKRNDREPKEQMVVVPQ